MAQLSGMADGTTQSDYANARVDASSGALVETDPWSSGQTFKALMQKYNENWPEFAADNPGMVKLGQNGKVPAGQKIAIRANHFTAYAHNPYTGPVNGFPPPTALGTPPKLPTGGAPIAPPPVSGGAPIAAPTPQPADSSPIPDPTDGTDPSLGGDPTDPTDPTSGTDPSTLGAAPAAPTDPTDPTAPADPTSGADPSTLGAAPADPTNPTDPAGGTDPSMPGATPAGGTDQQPSGGTGTDATTLGAAPTGGTDQQPTDGTGTDASTLGAAPTDGTDPTDSIGTDASTLGAAPNDGTDQQSTDGTGTDASTLGASSTSGTDQQPTDGTGTDTSTLGAAPTDSNGQPVTGGTTESSSQTHHGWEHDHIVHVRDGKRSKGGAFGIKFAIANLTSRAAGFRSMSTRTNRETSTVAGTITEPVTSSPTQLASTTTVTDQTYTVAPGNTMTEIAQNHGISLASLEAANPNLKDPNLIFPGQVIHMPDNSTAAPTPQVATAAEPHNPSPGGVVSMFPTTSTYPPGENTSSSPQPIKLASADEGGGAVTGGASPFGASINAPDHKKSHPGESPKKPTSGIG